MKLKALCLASYLTMALATGQVLDRASRARLGHEIDAAQAFKRASEFLVNAGFTKEQASPVRAVMRLGFDVNQERIWTAFFRTGKGLEVQVDPKTGEVRRFVNHMGATDAKGKDLSKAQIEKRLSELIKNLKVPAGFQRGTLAKIQIQPDLSAWQVGFQPVESGLLVVSSVNYRLGPNFAINGRSGQLISYARFRYSIESNPVRVPAEQAAVISQRIAGAYPKAIPGKAVFKPQLAYAVPNGVFGAEPLMRPLKARKAFIVRYSSGAAVWIDVTTGKCIGGFPLGEAGRGIAAPAGGFFSSLQ
jgi:hypothetical protein